ncbi:hypothetical protein HK102_008389, partial [Quaeritorhiza haematococci]
MLLHMYHPGHPDLRRNFWVTLARIYDADQNGELNRVELSTMLDTLGSTFSDESIDMLFAHHNKPITDQLTYDQVFESIEARINAAASFNSSSSHTISNNPSAAGSSPSASFSAPYSSSGGAGAAATVGLGGAGAGAGSSGGLVSSQTSASVAGMFAGMNMGGEGLSSSGGAAGLAGSAGAAGMHMGGKSAGGAVYGEHVIQINECPVCGKAVRDMKQDLDIVSHVALCVYDDQDNINKFVLGGFLTQAYATRKWYTKILSYVTYGSYNIGKNNANILVQDRQSGQLIEERMPIYIRLGIRLLYQIGSSRS